MGKNELVLSGGSDRSIGDSSNIKRGIDAEIRKPGAETGPKSVDLPEWRFHDFRRSGVTALAGLGFAPHVCDRLLNHATGAIQGVVSGLSAGGVPCRAAEGAGSLGGQVLTPSA